MSASVRRIKERGGGGGKIAASPAGRVSPVSGRSVSVGKDNPRPTSRPRAATQKPTLKPMARVDKSAVAMAAPVAEESRSRWSTSSVPRGRSSSPSEFTSAMSDLRKNPLKAYMGSARGKENGVGLKRLSGKPGEKPDLDNRFEKELSKNGKFPFLGEVDGASQKKDKIKTRVLNNGGSDMKEQNLGLVSLEKPNLEEKLFKDLKKSGQFEEIVTVLTGSSEEKERNSTSVTAKESDSVKSSLEVGLKNCKVGEEIKVKPSMVGVQPGLMVVNKISNCDGASRDNVAANNYPSRLHEKLAFLEGKVKRIASDIKKTKEILDSNNPDTSKMMLSDIQEKITGIEKAMVYVKTGEHNQDVKEVNGVKDGKSSGKGLNSEELEARLFPHHKLIRDRTLLKSTSMSTLVVDEKSTNTEDNSVAMGLSAFLCKEESHTDPKASELQEMDDSVNSMAESSSFTAPKGKDSIDALLMADERLNEFDDEENRPAMVSEDEADEHYTHKLNDIGGKTSTAGWFVSDGESALLAHGDGSCSFYDIVNSELKAEYKPPGPVSPNIWQDCWIIRAPSADGCSGRYVVAASAGNSVYSGFCSWDFYTKKIHAFHIEDDSETNLARPALAPLSNNTMRRRPSLSTAMAAENSQWWYRPCGPLIMSGSSCQRMVQIFDIRDGEGVMKWELQKPPSAMDYASPLQWRNRGKVAIAESDLVSLWDVSSLSSQPLLSVSSSGRKISAFHVNNTDAELGGGVRQRVSSSEAEGNDGVFCTSDSINVLDFRLPSGIGLKMPKVGMDAQSAFSRGDSIYIGCSSLRSSAKKQYSSQIQQFSLRKQRLFNTYTLPESNAHSSVTALTQVWGTSNYVMGVCGLGLYVFDSPKEEGLPSFTMDYSSSHKMEIIGPDDMYNPSFDYSSSRVLLISQDRPAQWRYLF